MPDFSALTRAIKMRLLPPSSRSFHDASGELHQKIDDLSRQLRDSETRLQEQLQHQTDWMYDEMERHARNAKARDMHALFYLDGLYRKDGEEHRDTLARLFSGLPKAEGYMRLSQMAATRMMDDLDAICKELGIEYWIASGALVAAIYRNGFIPWDDDIDIGMRREDVSRLAEHLRKANGSGGDANAIGRGYQVTTIYDCIVKVRQVRFSLIDSPVPCFIDLVSYDPATTGDPARNRRIWREHDAMVAELEEMATEGGELAYWREHLFLRADGRSGCAQVSDVDWDALDPQEEHRCVGLIESVMDRHQQSLVDEGILLDHDGEGRDAPGMLSYGIDNLCEVRHRPFLWDSDLLLPTGTVKFEGHDFSVPHRAAEVCDINYGRETPYLPNDIFCHSHFAEGLMSHDEVIDAMARYIAGNEGGDSQ